MDSFGSMRFQCKIQDFPILLKIHFHNGHATDRCIVVGPVCGDAMGDDFKAIHHAVQLQRIFQQLVIGMIAGALVQKYIC